MRKNWDEYFMDIVEMVKTRSTCPRLSVGCVIVKDKKIISTGFNGSPTKTEQCDEVGCLIKKSPDGKENCVRVVHGEQNALLQAGKEAIGGTIYINYSPCPICVKLLIQAGIKRIVYKEPYKIEDIDYWIQTSGVVFEQWQKKE